MNKFFAVVIIAIIIIAYYYRDEIYNYLKPVNATETPLPPPKTTSDGVVPVSSTLASVPQTDVPSIGDTNNPLTTDAVTSDGAPHPLAAPDVTPKIVTTGGPLINTATAPVTATASALPSPPSRPVYQGCYADVDGRYPAGGSIRAIPNKAGIMDMRECNNAAKAAESNYFGLQYWPITGASTPGTKGECWHGGPGLTLAEATKFGQPTQGINGAVWSAMCDMGTDGYLIGNGHTNAIYATVAPY